MGSRTISSSSSSSVLYFCEELSTVILYTDAPGCSTHYPYRN